MYSNDTNTKKKRRLSIIETAKILIENNGIANTTFNEIAKLSGVARSTMYEYFSSKEEMLLYIREIYLNNMYSINIEVNPTLSGIEQLEIILYEYFDLMLANPGALKYFMDYNRYTSTRPDTTNILPMVNYNSHLHLHNAILKGQLDGSLTTVNTEIRISIIVEALFGTATRFAIKDEYIYEQRTVTLDKTLIRQLVPILIHGVNM